MLKRLINFLPTDPQRSLKYQSVIGYTNVRSNCRPATYLIKLLDRSAFGPFRTLFCHRATLALTGIPMRPFSCVVYISLLLTMGCNEPVETAYIETTGKHSTKFYRRLSIHAEPDDRRTAITSVVSEAIAARDQNRTPPIAFRIQVSTSSNTDINQPTVQLSWMLTAEYTGHIEFHDNCLHLIGPGGRSDGTASDANNLTTIIAEMFEGRLKAIASNH